MNKLKQRLLLIAAAILLIGAVLLGNRLISGPKNQDTKDNQTGIWRVPVNQPVVEGSHPYGNPVKGVLMWENDRAFHEFCAAQHSANRLGAFQTTLPDPLPGEEDNVALAADFLRGVVIGPGKIFSLNARIGPYNRRRGYKEGPTYFGSVVSKTIGGGVCKIASTLYNVATLANLKVIERHSHSMPVPYVPPGQDATVSDGSKDFKFQNNTDNPVFIWADTRKNTLYIAIYGRNRPPKVSWKHHILNRQPTRTIYQVNRRLKPGEERVIVPGADGVTVKSWLIIEYSDGAVVTKRLGIDYYRPLPNVIEKG